MRAVFLFATWDSRFWEKKDNFCDECRKYNIPFECVDVDENVGITIKHQIKNVPAIIIYGDKGNVLGIEKGNTAYTKLKNYIL